MPGVTVGAPVGGWNAINSQAEMPQTDALVMDNLIPDAESVASRKGYAAHTDTVRSDAATLASYNGSTPVLLLAGAGNIYDITSAGAGTDLTSGLAAFANNQWHTNGYKDKIIFCNSADYPVEYDSDAGTVSVLGITGPLSVDFAVNGEFAADTDWTKGTGWTISAGTASSDGTQAGDSDLENTGVAVEAGKNYSVTYTVSGYSAGNVTAVAGSVEGTDRSANGTYTDVITASDTGVLMIRADLDFIGNIDDVSIQRVSIDDFAGSMTFKGRVIYWEKPDGTNPQAFWYCSAGAYTGAVTKFTLNEFSKTGHVIACSQWTHDGGLGLDDHFVVLMSTGEVLIYSGSDPGDATDWSLVGKYSIGEPLGKKCITQVGGDAVILSRDGYLILSAAIQEGRYSENSMFSFKINPAAAQAAQDYGSNYGWGGTLYTNENLFIVNVPISAYESIQHVRNTTTGAWCSFSGINAVDFAEHNNRLYFVGTDGLVYVYQGTSDAGGFIPIECHQAYNHLGNPHIKKQVTGVEVFSNYSYPKYLHSKFFADFNAKSLSAIPDPPEPAPSDWDVGEWDVAEWDSATAGTNTAIRNATGYGFFLSHVLRLKSRAQTFRWYATRYIIKPGGIV